MSPRSLALGVSVSLFTACAGAALLEPPAEPKPPVKQSEPAKPDASKKDVPAKDAAPAFPKAVKKNLYAKNDLRGKKAPEFSVQKWLSAEPDRKNKVVLIDFWATWCPPCRELIPELNEFQTKFKDDLVVIGVSDEDAKKVEDFGKKTKFNYAMAIDAKAKMKNAVGVEGIPHVLIIDSTGIVRWQGFPQGEEKLTEAIVKQIIDADKAQRKDPGKPDTTKPDTAKPDSKPSDNKDAPPSDEKDPKKPGK